MHLLRNHATLTMFVIPAENLRNLNPETFPKLIRKEFKVRQRNLDKDYVLCIAYNLRHCKLFRRTNLTLLLLLSFNAVFLAFSGQNCFDISTPSWSKSQHLRTISTNVELLFPSWILNF